MALNSIGPSVMIARRHGKWTIRFRLPTDVAELYTLPKLPRLASRLPEHATHDDLVREANRIGHKLDLLIRGEWSPNGESLAHWLGLPEPAKRKSSRRPRAFKGSLWSDLVHSYSDDFKSQSMARESNERITLGRLKTIEQSFPERHPDTITARDWDTWLDTLTSGPVTVNKMRSLVSRVYDHGLRNYRVKENPIHKVPHRKKRRSAVRHTYRTMSMIQTELDMRAFTEDEARELKSWRVLDEQEQQDLIALAIERSDLGMLCPVILGLHGLSGIDIRQMRRGAYEPRTGIVSGRRHKTGMVSFHVPIAPTLKSHLDKHLLTVASGEWVFPHFHRSEDGTAITDVKCRFLRHWARLIKDTDFDGMRFHGLRHSFISTMLVKGVRAEQVARWVAHLDIRTTTEIYAHFMPDESVKLMASLKMFETG